MKPIKKISALILLVILTMVFSTDIDAQRPHKGHHPRHHDGGGRGGGVGAPLDGGLLALLAGAGITYYAARKRKRNQE